MIHGIGIDIVEIERIQQGLDKFGERYAKKILSDDEYDEFKYHNQAAAFLAKRFAVKEATAKAIGTGFRDSLQLRHISVVNDDLGKPSLLFTRTADALCREYGIVDAFVSIADERHYAVAQVVLIKQPS